MAEPDYAVPDDSTDSDDSVHGDRARAESFGSVADAYDRARPPYPDALMDLLASRGGTAVLDVGCGTGKAAVLLAARGMDVLGVEIDPGMAAVARTHGLDVEVGGFEAWDDRGRRFDLVTCAQAWHWIDPRAGAAKARRVLVPGGTLALFWNIHWLDDSVRRQMDVVYEQHAPELVESARRHGDRHDDLQAGGPRYGDSLLAAGFVDLGTRSFPWEHTYPRDDFLELLSTYSDHHLLPDDRRSALLAGVGAVVDGLGGTLDVHYEAHVVLAVSP